MTAQSCGQPPKTAFLIYVFLLECFVRYAQCKNNGLRSKRLLPCRSFVRLFAIPTTDTLILEFFNLGEEI